MTKEKLRLFHLIFVGVFRDIAPCNCLVSYRKKDNTNGNTRQERIFDFVSCHYLRNVSVRNDRIALADVGLVMET